MLKYFVLGLSAAAFALLFTPWVRRLAFWLDAVDQPGGRRLHEGRIPRLGGVAVLAAFLAALALGRLVEVFSVDVFLGYGWGWVCLLAGALLVCAGGAVDDIWSLGPLPKLAFQVLAGMITLAGGYGITTITNPLTGGGIELGWLATPLTLLWVVGITNAFNLIDGLDGLAAGVALIASTTLFVVSLAAGNVEVPLLAVTLAGTLAGFLCYNFNPASVFLGDSGSLLLGYLLSVLSIHASQKGATAVVVLTPLLALGLPIMDTLLAMLRRTLSALSVVRTDPERNEYHFFRVGSASIFRADRDHIHHRLLTLGLTQRRVVLLLYGVCALFGVTALLAVTAHGIEATLLVACTCGASYVGVRHLGYREVQILRRGTLLPLFELPMLNRRLVHALVDSGFIAAAYLAALLVVDGGVLGDGTRNFFLKTVAVVAGVKLITLVYSGLYKRTYRYTNVADLIGVVKGVVGAETVAAVVLAMAFGIPHRAPTTLVLDFYLTATLVIGARLLFKVLEVLHHEGNAPGGRAAFIYGAGSRGAMLLQQLRHNPSLGHHVIGFVDDHGSLWGRRVNGIPVLGGLDKLPALILEHQVSDVILADTSIGEERIQAVAEVCAGVGARLRRLQLFLEPLFPPSDGLCENCATIVGFRDNVERPAPHTPPSSPDTSDMLPSHAASDADADSGNGKQSSFGTLLWGKPEVA